MEQMTDAYMAWSLASAEEGLCKLYKHPEDAVVEERTPIYVVDLFCNLFFWFGPKSTLICYSGLLRRCAPGAR
jgi:hypothetical protein